MTTSFQACADLRFIFQCQVFQYKTNKRVRHALGKDLQLNSSLNGETRLYTNNNTYIHISYTTYTADYYAWAPSFYLFDWVKSVKQLELVKTHQRHSFSSSILRGQIRRKGQRVLQYQGALTCLALVFTCPLTFLKIWTDRCRWVYVGVEDDDDDDDEEMFRSDSIWFDWWLMTLRGTMIDSDRSCSLQFNTVCFGLLAFSLRWQEGLISTKALKDPSPDEMATMQVLLWSCCVLWIMACDIKWHQPFWNHQHLSFLGHDWFADVLHSKIPWEQQSIAS